MENQMENTASQDSKKGFFRGKARAIFILALIILILAGIGYRYNRRNQASKMEDLKQKTLDFVKKDLVQPGVDVQITNIEDEGSLYKLIMKVNNQELPVYLSKDGSKFFPQAFELDKKEEKGKDDSQQPVTTPTATEAESKTDKPLVELFVMSHCPYGTQAEKGIIPAIQKLGSKIDFKLKFVDYILHGKKEFDENLFQYCLQKEQPSKLLGYLDCFNKSGDSAKCFASLKIDRTRVSSCTSATDNKFKLTETFNKESQKTQVPPPFNVDKEENDKYGVQGSPALVVNGTVIKTGRDSASMLKAICSGFKNQPEECKADLSAAVPVPGFGEGNASNSNSGSCGQ